MNDYSQHGEGKILAELVGTQKGTLISFGENDGKTLSNVLGLIEAGWKAHLVEPSKTAFSKMKDLHKENKNVSCYNYAIADHNGEVEFHESDSHVGNGDTSLLSTIIPSEIDRWKGTQEFTPTIVPCKTVESFINDTKGAKATIVSIDCEGVDYEIMTQLPFNTLNTKIVVVETNSVEDEKYIDFMQKKFGFYVHHKNFCNIIFVR